MENPFEEPFKRMLLLMQGIQSAGDGGLGGNFGPGNTARGEASHFTERFGPLASMEVGGGKVVLEILALACMTVWALASGGSRQEVIIWALASNFQWRREISGRRETQIIEKHWVEREGIGFRQKLLFNWRE
ncbi:hypothetical protein Adt_33662 [Abeliophyllum distichum]|uniref:Uncharacterized protein n=1 Tax=Abeliophyllum distichum TaxID=126358 RepID=A0ABD1QWW0_9LAMI